MGIELHNSQDTFDCLSPEFLSQKPFTNIIYMNTEGLNLKSAEWLLRDAEPSWLPVKVNMYVFIIKLPECKTGIFATNGNILTFRNMIFFLFNFFKAGGFFFSPEKYSYSTFLWHAYITD